MAKFLYGIETYKDAKDKLTPKMDPQFDENGNLRSRGGSFTEVFTEVAAFIEEQHSDKTQEELLEEEQRRIFENTSEQMLIIDEDTQSDRSIDELVDSLSIQLIKQFEKAEEAQAVEYVRNIPRIKKILKIHNNLVAAVIDVLRQLGIKLPDRQYMDEKTKQLITTYIDFSHNRKFTVDQLTKGFLLAASTLNATSTEVAYLKRLRDQHQKRMVEYEAKLIEATRLAENVNEERLKLLVKLAAFEPYEFYPFSETTSTYLVYNTKRKTWLSLKDSQDRKLALINKLGIDRYSSSKENDRLVVKFSTFNAAFSVITGLQDSYNKSLKKYKHAKRKDSDITLRDFYKGPRRIRDYVVVEIIMRRNMFLERKQSNKLKP